MIEWPTGKYKTILADPPWRYRDEKGKNPKLGGITYPTMSDAEILALPVAEKADADCMLCLWATMPKLPEAISVIQAWGFRYVTCAFVWVKTYQDGRIYSGLGHWVIGNA